jgi:hypothetical protein
MLNKPKMESTRSEPRSIHGPFASIADRREDQRTTASFHKQTAPVTLHKQRGVKPSRIELGVKLHVGAETTHQSANAWVIFECVWHVTARAKIVFGKAGTVVGNDWLGWHHHTFAIDSTRIVYAIVWRMLAVEATEPVRTVANVFETAQIGTLCAIFAWAGTCEMSKLKLLFKRREGIRCLLADWVVN